MINAKSIEMNIEKNMKNAIDGKIPISHNPRFSNVCNNYASKYNDLSERLQDANIDISLLIDLVQATKEFEQLGYIECYKLGFTDAMASFVSILEQESILPATNRVIC